MLEQLHVRELEIADQIQHSSITNGITTMHRAVRSSAILPEIVSRRLNYPNYWGTLPLQQRLSLCHCADRFSKALAGGMLKRGGIKWPRSGKVRKLGNLYALRLAKAQSI